MEVAAACMYLYLAADGGGARKPRTRNPPVHCREQDGQDGQAAGGRTARRDPVAGRPRGGARAAQAVI